MPRDWMDEIVKAEPELDSTSFSEESREKLTEKTLGVEEYWAELESREHRDGAFRLLPDDGESLNCLGKTLRLSMYAEVIDDVDSVSSHIYFEEEGEGEDLVFNKPYITPLIDGEEYGSKGPGKPEAVPTEALADLYKVGLGVKMIDGELEKKQELIEAGLNYDILEEWGEGINEKYSQETEGPTSRYLSVQGGMMEEEAPEAESEYKNGIILC